jgi:hypothetical protein
MTDFSDRVDQMTIPCDFLDHCSCVGSLLGRLSKDDLTAYATISSRFRANVHGRKHSGPANFSEQLRTLHSFICRSESNRSLRAMLCGIFFGRGFICVNTFRLKKLLLRSKSGMNNRFQKLGYDVMRPSRDLIELFQALLPDVDQGVCLVRQWCLRIQTDESKLTFESHIPEEVAATFEVERIKVRDLPGREVSPLDVRSLLNREPLPPIRESMVE